LLAVTHNRSKPRSTGPANTDRAQKEVVCYFFGIGVDHPLSLEDIGEKFNLTRERVRQIKDKAITELRTTQKQTC
jgi:DNA-directed RNA polymerase sigma subunit (sigma70/sigma32)